MLETCTVYNFCDRFARGVCTLFATSTSFPRCFQLKEALGSGCDNVTWKCALWFSSSLPVTTIYTICVCHTFCNKHIFSLCLCFHLKKDMEAPGKGLPSLLFKSAQPANHLILCWLEWCFHLKEACSTILLASSWNRFTNNCCNRPKQKVPFQE